MRSLQLHPLPPGVARIADADVLPLITLAAIAGIAHLVKVKVRVRVRVGVGVGVRVRVRVRVEVGVGGIELGLGLARLLAHHRHARLARVLMHVHHQRTHDGVDRHL